MKNNKYIITISYGNYVCGKGGTDKVILSQQKIFNQNGYSVVHIYNVHGIGKYIKINNSNFWNVLIDGEFSGMFTTADVCNLILEFQKQNINLYGIYIHHLKSINIYELIKMLDYVNSNIYFYIHDYMTICPESGLIDDTGRFCGDDGFYYDKCYKCRYYNKKSISKISDIELLFEKIKNKVTFIAPSEVAKNVWLKSYPDLEKNVKVIYHQKLKGEYKENLEEISEKERLRIAFVGYQRKLKGWNHWKEATQKILNNNISEKLYQFGTAEDMLPNVEIVNVDFTKDLDSMITMLRKYKIHCAVLWSLLPETYSYTYYEALAANCYVLTNSKSGNIAYQTSQNGNGFVAKDEDSLTNLLLNEKQLRTYINEFRQKKRFGPLYLLENDDIIQTLFQKPIYVNGIIHNSISDVMKKYIIVSLKKLYIFLKKVF